MTDHSPNVVTFAVTGGIFGVGRLATQLKPLESIDQIGPWHVGHPPSEFGSVATPTACV